MDIGILLEKCFFRINDGVVDNSGAIENGSSLAMDFMSLGTISEVYAWDGTSTFMFSTGVSITVFSFSVDEIEYSAIIDLNPVYEYCQSNVDAFIDALIDYGIDWSFDHEDWDGFDLGLVWYYLNSSGEVCYENVSDIDIFSNCWICVEY